jgi:hypothetical protein
MSHKYPKFKFICHFDYEVFEVRVIFYSYTFYL